MGRFRTKPEEVEAVQWTGTNREEVEALDPDHIAYYRLTDSFLFDTPESYSGCDMLGLNDYLIKGADGLLRRLKSWEFDAKYEPVDELRERAAADRCEQVGAGRGDLTDAEL